MREFFPTAPATIGRIFYVSQQGSDSGDGSAGRPFRTISRGARELRAADTLIVGGGLYRETVPLSGNGHCYHPESVIRIEAAPGEKVWLRASEEFHAFWRKVGEDLYAADLPEALFRPGAYNPFALDLDFCNPTPVRPGSTAPVRGIFWIDGVPGHSRERLEEPGDFRISADGKTVEMRFPAERSPAECFLEISVRRRCLEPQFPGPAFYAVRGIDVGHAVEPGAFDGPRDETLHRYPAAGVTVTRRFVAPPAMPGFDIPFNGALARLANGSIIGGKSTPPEDGIACFGGFTDRIMIGTPDGLHWRALPQNGDITRSNFFFDPTRNLLFRYWAVREDQADNFSVGAGWTNRIAFSRDAGKSWSAPETIPGRNRLLFNLHPLPDGSFLLFYTTQDPTCPFHHSMTGTMIGTPRGDSFDWSDGGLLQVSPQESSMGLDEPHGAVLPDGRILVLLRAGARLPGDGIPGVTSGKLYSISRDNGAHWSRPEFLRYDDGGTVYSPRSFQDLFVSRRNGKVYAVLSISPEPCWNCDPRNRLSLGEIDTASFTLKRQSIIPVEEMCPDHHPLVRFSNWQQLEDSRGDLLLFMTIGAAEGCFVRDGWDKSLYCYRVEFQR